MTETGKLVMMANQIARNLAAQGDARAIAATARHIRDFWSPQMIAAIRTHDGAGLDPLARQAIAALNGGEKVSL
jgi:formate dehydrogenase subunit delta